MDRFHQPNKPGEFSAASRKFTKLIFNASTKWPVWDPSQGAAQLGDYGVVSGVSGKLNRHGNVYEHPELAKLLNNRRPQKPEPDDFLVIRSLSARRDDSFCKPDENAIFNRGWTFGKRLGAILVAYKPTTTHLPHKININEFKAHPALRGMALVTSVTTASAFAIYLGTRFDDGFTLKLVKSESPDGVPTWEAEPSGGIYKCGSPKAAVQVFYSLKQCLPVVIGQIRALAKPANNWGQVQNVEPPLIPRGTKPTLIDEGEEARGPMTAISSAYQKEAMGDEDLVKPEDIPKEIRDPGRQAMVKALQVLEGLRLPFHQVIVDRNASLGQGGFGDVFLGHIANDSSNNKVAVKVMRTAVGDEKEGTVALRIARELKVWGGLRHPNIMPLSAFCLSKDLAKAWLISPYAPGGNIMSYVGHANPDLATRIALILDTAQGLAYLHGLDPPVCHGDIKAANALVNQDNRAALCDFGLSEAVTMEHSGLTTSQTLRGTLRYYSPELLLDDDATLTIPSDIWAWGCLAAEILTGKIPYEQIRKEITVISRILANEKPVEIDIKAVPSRVVQCFDQCWKPDPTERLAVSSYVEILVSVHTEVLGTSNGAGEVS